MTNLMQHVLNLYIYIFLSVALEILTVTVPRVTSTDSMRRSRPFKCTYALL